MEKIFISSERRYIFRNNGVERGGIDHAPSFLGVKEKETGNHITQDLETFSDESEPDEFEQE